MRQQEITRLLKSGKWMIRTDMGGQSYQGFTWAPKGEWTNAPDWDGLPQCGNGLHGQNQKGYGYCKQGNRLILCEIDQCIVIDGNKVKTNRARIIAINAEIPSEFLRSVSLDLIGCDLKGITLPQSVGGYLYLSGCDLKGITLPERFRGKIVK